MCPPELLASDDPVEVPGDALGAHEGEDLGVLCVTQLQEPGQQRHRGLGQIWNNRTFCFIVISVK